MINANDALKQIIEKCDIQLEDEVISKELLLRSLADFYIQTSDKEKHNTGFVMHTGSICFDTITVLYAIAACMVYNENDVESIISSLNTGDMVLYGEKKRERFTFGGIIENPFFKGKMAIKLNQTKGNCVYVPEARWKYITPYYGDSKRFDGRGIRKITGIREVFYKDVLKVDEKDIPGVSNASVVIAIPKERASFLMKNMKISVDGRMVNPLELITASYFTENEEFPFGGNVGKQEPNIKFAGKVSVARNLVVKRGGNKHIGVIISDEKIISTGISEIPELLQRRSLQFVYICGHIDSNYITDIISKADNPSVFICSKGYLLSNPCPMKGSGKYCEELSKQIDIVKSKQISNRIINTGFIWKDYRSVKKSLLYIKNYDFHGTDKEKFIIHSYSLLNLFTTAVFKISDMEKCISDGIINIESPSEKLNALEEIATRFPDELEKHTQKILDYLNTAYLETFDNCEKANCLVKTLSAYPDKRTALIVPKAYYIDILRFCGIYDLFHDKELLTIVNNNRFDNSTMYDRIAVSGDFYGKRFDYISCYSAKDIELLLYDCEVYRFRYRKREAIKKENFLNSLTLTSDKTHDYTTQENTKHLYDDEVSEVAEIDNDVEEYIEKINDSMLYRSFYINSSSRSDVMADVVAFGGFDSGEKIFFTKNYKAYVFDEVAGSVVEKNATDLAEGDSLVFTKKGAEARDIVDVILEKLVSNEKLSQDIRAAYKKSKAWKQALTDYMISNELSPKEIAARMIKNGVNVQEAAIKGWLDEDSHTVGPRKAESIQQIALLVKDNYMFEHADEYFEACRTVRHIRRKIINGIGIALINKLCGNSYEHNEIADYIYERLDSIALILRLETIEYIDKKIPGNYTNRPLSVQEA